MVVRVIRVLEYEYADHERAEQDMACWQVPPNGTREFGTSRTAHALVRIRSATTFPAMSESGLEPTEDDKE